MDIPHQVYLQVQPRADMAVRLTKDQQKYDLCLDSTYWIANESDIPAPIVAAVQLWNEIAESKAPWFGKKEIDDIYMAITVWPLWSEEKPLGWYVWHNGMFTYVGKELI